MKINQNIDIGHSVQTGKHMNERTELTESDLTIVDLGQRIEMSTTLPPDVSDDSVTITTTWAL